MTQPKKQNPTGQHTVLLATDLKKSVHAEIHANNTNLIRYSPYGHLSAQLAVMTRLGFNGELREPGFDWYLLGNGYRAYNPRLMRFNSPDSLSPHDKGGRNAYMYCHGEPVMNSDPSGHALLPLVRTGFTYFIEAKNTFFSTYQAQRTVGQNPLKALVSTISDRGRLLQTMGASNPKTIQFGNASTSKVLPTARSGGLHQNVVGESSASGNASNYFGGSSRQPANSSNPPGYGNSPHLKKLQERSDAHPRNLKNGATNTSTGHPSSYGPSNAPPPVSQRRIPSSSSPYAEVDPNSLDTGRDNIRKT